MLRRVTFAIVGGLALWLSFPSMGLWFFAPVGVALLAVATAGAAAWQGAVLGLLTGVAFFWPLLTWIGIYLGPLPVIALVALESLFTALAGWAMAVVQRPVGRGVFGAWSPLFVALAWLVAEWLRSIAPFGGFGWGRLAFGQADAPYAPIVAYVGANGLSFLVALVGALLAFVVVRILAPPTALDQGATVPAPSGREVLTPLGVAAVLALAPALLPTTFGAPEGQAQVIAIQGNVPKPGLDFNEERRAVTDNHARATVQAAQRVAAGELPVPDLVLWPENSSDIDPLRNDDAKRVITSAVSAIGAPTLVGAVLREPGENLSNAALLYQPGGEITERYVKQRPVPFAEYMPYRSFFRAITPMVDLLSKDFVPGDRDVVFTVPSASDTPIRFASPICFEVSIDDVMAAPVAMGANLLVVPTNNATFGYTDESVQQLAISRIRAMEFGRAIVHISTVGVSALITPDGTAHQQTSLFTQEILAGELPLLHATTPATHLGAWPMALAVPLLAWGLLRGLRRPRAPRQAVRRRALSTNTP